MPSRFERAMILAAALCAGRHALAEQLRAEWEEEGLPTPVVGFDADAVTRALTARPYAAVLEEACGAA